MPRLIDYPRASLKNALELAKSTDALGGSGSVGTIAESMGLKESGAFSALVGGAVKYGLLVSQKGVISTTSLYKEYKLAYSEEDAIYALRKAFLHVPLFQKIYDRFAGQALPIKILDKLLIKEFQVDEGIASRVRGYLVDAAKMARILGENDVLLGAPTVPDEKTAGSPAPKTNVEPVEDTTAGGTPSTYIIHFRGPGMDSRITVKDEDDMEIVKATLKKVEKRLSSSKDENILE